MEHVVFKTIEGVPNEEVLKDLIFLYTSVFDSAQIDFFKERLFSKEDVIIVVAYIEQNPIAFKIGYQYNENTFYSWVGGVLRAQRKKGVGQYLMNVQHTIAKEKGYTKVRTKSMNSFKPMMILNLQNKFNIIMVYTNSVGQTKIVFEKEL